MLIHFAGGFMIGSLVAVITMALLYMSGEHTDDE